MVPWWKLRARNGDRVKWYEDVKELAGRWMARADLTAPDCALTGHGQSFLAARTFTLGPRLSAKGADRPNGPIRGPLGDGVWPRRIRS